MEYSDPNVLGSRWTAALAYVDSSDGSQRIAQLSHPFYALDTPWSATLSGQTYDRTVSRYSLGDIVDQFNDNEQTYLIGGGVSTGLVDGWTKRLLFGMYYDRNDFLPTPATTLPAKPLPPQRTLSYPFVGFDILQDKYGKAGDENQIGKTEDLYFGTEVTGELGFSDAAFGANHDALMVKSAAVHGAELPYEQQLFLSADFSSRFESDQARNLISDADAKYYWRWRPDWLLYGSLSGTVTHALDPDVQLLLGGDNGLRGYPLRYEAGTSRGLLTIEQRVFTDWYPFRLVRVGGRSLYRRRQDVGNRRRGQQRSGHAQRRRVRPTAGQCAQRPRQRTAYRFRVSAQGRSRQSQGSNYWCRRCKASRSMHRSHSGAGRCQQAI